jgi:uncharacterized protein (DUF1778 family)
MVRPHKKPSDRKTIHLRVPITADQKQTVDEAMAIDGREFAGWARSLILEHAQAILDQSKQRQATKRSGELPKARNRPYNAEKGR